MSHQETTAPSRFRAIIAAGRLTIAAWHPQLLLPRGPKAVPFRACEYRGVAIAELTIIRDPAEPLELIVSFLTAGEQAGVRDTILRWATALGYAGVWLGDELIEIVEEIVSQTELAWTQCLWCGTCWEEHKREFWSVVRDVGFFPMTCPLCGCDLPQWEVDPESTQP